MKGDEMEVILVVRLSQKIGSVARRFYSGDIECREVEGDVQEGNGMMKTSRWTVSNYGEIDP